MSSVLNVMLNSYLLTHTYKHTHIHTYTHTRTHTHDNASIIFDFGRNLAGTAELRLLANTVAGTAVKLVYGEVLHPGGGAVAQSFGQEDSFIYGNNSTGTWSPSFVYHG